METFTEAELSFMAQFFLNHVGYPDEDGIVKSVIDKFDAMGLPGFNMDWEYDSGMNTVAFTTYDK